MANPNVPSRGNSQQQMPQPPQTGRPPPRELHPAAADAVARYSAVFDENDKLREENAKLRSENEVMRRVDAEKSQIVADLRRTFDESISAADGRVAAAEANFRERVTTAEAHFRDRLAVCEREKEVYRRFAISLDERLDTIVEGITAARSIATEMAHKRDDKPVEQVEQAIADIVKQGQGQERAGSV